MEQNHIEILCVTEHWLTEDNRSILNRIDGFDVISFFGRSHNTGGGSFIAVRQTLEASHRSDIHSLSIESVIECSAVEINRGSPARPLVIVTLYHPPTSSNSLFLEQLEKMFSILVNEISRKDIIFCGDFNVDALGDSVVKRDLFYLFEAFGMTSHISCPTRVTNSSKTAIDYVVSNRNAMEIKIIELGLSDHSAQLVALPSAALNNRSVTRVSQFRRIFSRSNKEHFKNSLRVISWERVFDVSGSNINIDTNFNAFLNVILLNFEQHFPKKPVKVCRKSKPWLTSGIKISLENKRRMSVIAKHSANRDFVSYYKAYVKLLRKVILNSKKMCNDKRIRFSQNKPKTTWNIVKQETGKETKKKDINRIMVNNVMLYDSDLIAEHFNRFFIHEPAARAPRANASDSLVKLHSFKSPISSSMFLFPVTEQEVLQVISSLKNKTSSGWDEISSSLLRFCSRELALPLSILINQSLESGCFPSRLKYSTVHPLHKKDDPSCIANFRPIALVSTFSKVFEKVVLLRLSNHLAKFHVINKQQHGFQSGKATIDALYDFSNHLLQSLDKSQRTLGIFCDLSRAFDSVNHSILLDKLSHYGVRGIAFNWFQSFLTGRQQRVLIKNSSGSFSSSYQPVDQGVPQGSIISPLLFILYINDLQVVGKHCHLTMFADDVSVLVSGRDRFSLEDNASGALSSLKEWFDSNGLLLNINKTCSINFTLNRNHSFDPIIPSLNSATSFKFLGVWFEKSFSWQLHVEKLLRRINSALFAIRILKQTCSVETLIDVYRGYCESILRYGIAIWGNSHLLDKLLKIQKNILRVIFSLCPRHPCKKIFQQHEILTVFSLYIQDVLILTFKNISSFNKTGDFHRFHTRQGSMLSFPIHRTSAFEKGPLYSGARFFNRLPGEIKAIRSLPPYKRALKTWLISKAFYSIDEFFNCT
jgi:exonuclease III